MLNLPDRSLVYDVATEAWAERSSSADGSGPWLPSAVGHTDIVNHFGSSADGRSYLINPAGLDFIVDTDNDITVMRQFITPPLWAGTYRAFCARLEIEMEVGGLQPTRDVVLDWSDDGGRTWSAGRTMTAGVAYGDRVRVYTTRLGSFRQRMFRVTMTHHATIYGIDVDICEGQRLMALAPPPPVNEAPLETSGQHTQAWSGYFRSMSDALSQIGRGVTDGSDAAAGQVGEYLVASATGVALVSNNVANVVSLDLTGWRLGCVGQRGFRGRCGQHAFFGVGIDSIDTSSAATYPSTVFSMAMTTATHRYNLTATQTVVVVAVASFLGSVTADGGIRARRVR